MNHKHESSKITLSTNDSLIARSELFHSLNEYPASSEETERSLGLFLRGSLLARILGTCEIYQQILNLPGSILDIGTWRGQTAVLCENFRAIYEPLNFNRRVICFDTFLGYQGFGEQDKPTELHKDGTYGVGGDDYATYLSNLLQLHEKNNAMGHNHGKHSVISGDCRKTIPQFFCDHPQEFVSLAFFDLNSYQPTKDAFETVIARLVPGGVLAFWQLSRGEAIPAEGKFYAEEVIPKYSHSIRSTNSYPGLCYLIKTEK